MNNLDKQKVLGWIKANTKMFAYDSEPAFEDWAAGNWDFGPDQLIESINSGSLDADEWISCEERLPEILGHYLVVALDGLVLQAYINVNQEWCYNGKQLKDASHWMPSPSPPKAG